MGISLTLNRRYDSPHTDLSAFNMLDWDGTVTIIVLPQAVDPRFNGNAFNLLAHDVDQVCRYFARQGVASDPAAITIDLWTRFVNAQL
ncbi:MAG: hypothetical protein HY329_17860 [Chloroflexi bacterium]|nr:hypothetical protein [Chloroflexota bacterium]